MERRKFLESTLVAASAGLAGAVGITQAVAAEKKTVSASPLMIQDAAVLKQIHKLAADTAACHQKGLICAEHCQEQLAAGETQFSACSVAVRQMVILCDAVSQLATAKSVRLRETIDGCIAACQSCRDACHEHEAHWAQGMHLECKACADECDKVIATANETKKLLQKA